MMLSGIFSKKSDHPMANIKSAQALLEDLPKNDNYKSLMEISEWAESVADHTDFRLDHQFAVLRLLDESAQSYVRKLAYEYFSPQELSLFQENHLWLVLGNWHRHIARAYYVLFKRYYNKDKGADSIRTQLPLLVARTVSAMTGQLKFICSHYGPIDNTIWHHLAELYRLAEQQQYLDVPLELYNGSATNTSVRAELAKLLCWYSCGINTLKPLYIHLTERLTGQFSSSIQLSAEQDSHSLFCFDLEQPAAPSHIRSLGNASTRYISMAEMHPRLHELISILSKGLMPKKLNLGGIYHAEPVLEAAQYLLEYLTSPPSRGSARHEIEAGLRIMHGFARMIQRTDIELNFLDDSPGYWEAEDISASGFCALVPVGGTDGIRIGSLLGVQPDGVGHWGAAVVRRLMRDESNRLHVGAEMLSHQYSGVFLNYRGGVTEDGLPALWLQYNSATPVIEAKLLMKAGAFFAHRSLQTQLNDKNYLLIPEKLLEKGLDYDLATFRVIEQESETGDE